MYKLFLDDVRNPKDVKWVQLPLGPWVIVRNYNEFVAKIKEQMPLFIAFDHDLADEHYNPATWYWGPEGTEQYKEKTGYNCAWWLFNYCLENNLDMPQFLVHSLNPIGRERINNLLKNYESTRKDYNSV